MILYNVTNVIYHINVNSNYKINDLANFLNLFSQNIDNGIYILSFDSGQILCIKTNTYLIYKKIYSNDIDVIITLFNDNHFNNIKQFCTTNNISKEKYDQFIQNLYKISNDSELVTKIKDSIQNYSNLYTIVGGNKKSKTKNHKKSKCASEWTEHWLFTLISILLSIIGMAPGFGIPADILNAVLSWFECDYFGIAMSIIGAIPAVGIFSNGLKIGKSGFKLISKFLKTKKLAKKYKKAKKIYDKTKKIYDKASNVYNKASELKNNYDQISSYF